MRGIRKYKIFLEPRLDMYRKIMKEDLMKIGVSKFLSNFKQLIKNLIYGQVRSFLSLAFSVDCCIT
jgi:hypothetical protein